MTKNILIGVVLVGIVVVVVVISRNQQDTSPSLSPTPAASVSPATSPTQMPTPTPSSSRTPSPSPTRIPTPTPTPSSTATPTPTSTATPPPTPTPSPTPPPGPQTHAVTIQDFSYFPGTLNVKQGDLVRFTNKDAVNHDATHDGGEWNTPILSTNESYTLDTTELALGTYRYHCSIHGQTMVGTLRITQ